MQYKHGFVLTTVQTVDGVYTIYTRTVTDTEPVVFFPGIGLGCVPYWKLAIDIGCTVHLIEVPNISELLPLSPTPATVSTLLQVVEPYLHSTIIAHSLGTYHTSMIVNNSGDRVKKLVLFDPFCHPVAVVQTLMPLFCRSDDHLAYNSGHNGISVSWFRWLWMLFIARDLELQMFARHTPMEDLILLSDRPGLSILTVLSQQDCYLPYKALLDGIQGQPGQSIYSVDCGHGDLFFFPVKCTWDQMIVRLRQHVASVALGC
jgi:pimeloyl-ACP methyl ester carboxylesterase